MWWWLIPVALAVYFAANLLVSWGEQKRMDDATREDVR